ncbi:MAG TPA: ATP-binding cassette domain-containing protein [Nocardioides sp.]|uniref:ATP-binding cassette domain-containing protein n=1 Tax=uncultured Nocardioides sp. TaxID=198441 RepID=UPI002630C71B|nr:ATP-binding cassette domain-containing protein [uncultured Nocardioides sp.]HRD63009.1 ATP-binding cassette domain-containing protein [Nocardioides sp.]HRI96162.1 ATP-binding cassette domain-containing protein [Nocardioides sp.]HRK48045.1 ATP-binding cassette domain-containing protein [Nocardioides sp.]
MHDGLAAPSLVANSVAKRYGGRTALRGVTVGLSPGVGVLLGPNGAGKSTLCRILAGAEQPCEGLVESSMGSLGDRASRREHLAVSGWLPQAVTAPGTTTVFDYLNYAAWLKGIRRGSRPAAVARALELTDLTDRRRSLVRHLSGGMQRRLGLAQALVNSPSYLILDEPTAGLDPQQRDHLYGVISSIASDRVVLISTHLLEDVAVLARRIVVLIDGAVRFEGTPAAFAGLGRGEDDTARARSAFLSLLAHES